MPALQGASTNRVDCIYNLPFLWEIQPNQHTGNHFRKVQFCINQDHWIKRLKMHCYRVRIWRRYSKIPTRKWTCYILYNYLFNYKNFSAFPPVFVNILLQIETNPVKMHHWCLYSAVMLNLKRDYCYPKCFQNFTGTCIYWSTFWSASRMLGYLTNYCAEKPLIFIFSNTNLSHIALWHLVTVFSMSTGWYRMPRSIIVSSSGPTTNNASCRAEKEQKPHV